MHVDIIAHRVRMGVDLFSFGPVAVVDFYLKSITLLILIWCMKSNRNILEITYMRVFELRPSDLKHLL